MEYWNELYKSRLGQYLLYGFLYFVFWKSFGFELTVIMCLAFIAGDGHYKEIQKGSEKDIELPPEILISEKANKFLEKIDKLQKERKDHKH